MPKYGTLLLSTFKSDFIECCLEKHTLLPHMSTPWWHKMNTQRVIKVSSSRRLGITNLMARYFMRYYSLDRSDRPNSWQKDAAIQIATPLSLTVQASFEHQRGCQGDKWHPESNVHGKKKHISGTLDREWERDPVDCKSQDLLSRLGGLSGLSVYCKTTALSGLSIGHI